MKDVKRLDEQYQILKTYQEINEQVILGLGRCSKNPWPEDEDILQEIVPNYEILLSQIGFSKKLLKKYTSGDTLIQHAKLDEFNQDEQQDICKAINTYIAEPETEFKRATTPMALYHWRSEEPMSVPKHIIQLPRFYLGELCHMSEHSENRFRTWKELKNDWAITQSYLNNPKLDFEECWYFLFLYPAPNGKELQIRIMGSCYYFDEFDENCISHFMHHQLFPANSRWRDNQVPPSFEEFLMDEGNYQTIIKSFETTVDDLKNHPMLIAKRNLEKATVAYIQRLELD